ncbi:MAG: hypothetical protein ACI9TH_003751 [Kiritimatiellia bacterium]|jgi:hypothetical protein
MGRLISGTKDDDSVSLRHGAEQVLFMLKDVVAGSFVADLEVLIVFPGERKAMAG